MPSVGDGAIQTLKPEEKTLPQLTMALFAPPPSQGVVYKQDLEEASFGSRADVLGVGWARRGGAG